MFEAYLLTLAGLIAMQITPGPNLIAIAGAAMGQSRKIAIMVAVGIATGAAIWVALVAFGLGKLIEAYPSFVMALKLLGGGYLMWLGLKALRAAWRGDDVTLHSDNAAVTASEAWMKGLLVVMTNPKSCTRMGGHCVVLVWIRTFNMASGGICAFGVTKRPYRLWRLCVATLNRLCNASLSTLLAND